MFALVVFEQVLPEKSTPMVSSSAASDTQISVKSSSLQLVNADGSMMCSVATALAPGPRETVVAFATLLDSTTGRPIWTPLAANTTRGYPVREHGAEPVFVTTRSTLRVAAPDEASSWASTLMDPEAQGPPASAARGFRRQRGTCGQSDQCGNTNSEKPNGTRTIHAVTVPHPRWRFTFPANHRGGVRTGPARSRSGPGDPRPTSREGPRGAHSQAVVPRQRTAALEAAL